MTEVEKKKSLMELAEDIDRLYDQTAENGGVIDEALQFCIDVAEFTLAERCDAIGIYCKHMLPAEIDGLKAIKAAADAKIKALENKKRGLLEYVGRVTGGHKGKYTIYKRDTTSVQVDCDPAKLPEAGRIVKTEYVPDKKKLKEMLEAGEKIDGVTLLHGVSWCVR